MSGSEEKREMSKSLKDPDGVLEGFAGFIEALKAGDSVIIVEGKKDKVALESLGLENVMTLAKPLYMVIEEVASKFKRAVILTDLDKEGRLLYGKLSSGLQRHGVIVDNSLRNFLLKSTKLRQIEGIYHYFDVDR